MPKKMSDHENQIRLRLRDDFPFYAKNCLKIRTKSGDIIPFIMNKAQLHIHKIVELQRMQKGYVRVIICKGRQMGSTTLISGRFYWRATFRFGVRAFILTHEQEATKNLYEMAQRFHQHCPSGVKPHTGVCNANELLFDKLDSGYRLGTAGNKSTGRSATIQYLHASEAAFWENAGEHAKGIFQTVPAEKDTEIFVESTANGIGNYFHEQWQKAESGLSDYVAIFVPWYWQDEYRRKCDKDFKKTEEEEEIATLYDLSDEQINWRRYKIVELSVGGIDGAKAFCQEYPCIVGSQRVGTDRGLIPISELLPNDETNSGRVKKQWCSGKKNVIEIETELGYMLKCTTNHRVKVLGKDFVEAEKLSQEIIELSIPMFSKNRAILNWNPMPCVVSTIIIDKKFALFLGFYMGDGSYHGGTLSFAFNKADIESIECIRQLMIDLFDKEPHERKTSENGTELRFCCNELKPLFTELGIIEIKSYGTKRLVCVPEVIWRSPKHIIKEFLRGLFDADGFAHSKYALIKFFSKHPKFVQDIQLLLLGFGITSKRSYKEKIAGNGSKYIGNDLALRSYEAKQFDKKIGFVSQRKNDRLLRWKNNKGIGCNAKPIQFHDKIKSITPLESQLVYDLEMADEEHIFDAQGFKVHNCTAVEAFQTTGEDTFIAPGLVMAARRAEHEAFGPLLVGVDPARFGDDRTCIIRRKGRVAYGLEVYNKKDTMEIAGMVHSIIIKEEPDRVFIDIGGLGAGVYDRLKELGHAGTIVACNSGCAALDQSRYVNRRAENWALLKEWLVDGAQIPDNDELHADICGIKYKWDSKTRLTMEKKEDMKKRGLRSTDSADALCLTFHYPEETLYKTVNNSDKKAATSIMSHYNAVDRLKKSAYR